MEHFLIEQKKQDSLEKPKDSISHPAIITTIPADAPIKNLLLYRKDERTKTIPIPIKAVLDPEIETFFLTGEPKYTSVASTIVRDIIRNRGDASHFLPKVIADSIKQIKS